MMSLALISTTGFAHEPYVAPVAYMMRDEIISAFF